jgi:hypothetical protein
MLTQFVAWYLVVLLIQAAALPLAARLFGALPERGYALARPLGILLTGLLFWLGYSLGLVRNEAGGAWLALLAFAALSVALGRREIARWRRGEWRFGSSRNSSSWSRSRSGRPCAHTTPPPTTPKSRWT